MPALKEFDDTIVAISTPVGAGGIGIVRLSGAGAVSIADGMFRAKNKRPVAQFKNCRAHYGWVIKNNEVLDEALLTVMRAPHSYTKEDVVEISCHGGIVSLRTILNLAAEKGARLAHAGEFTKRAFLNGRIDLTQAEAVLDIIAARTNAFLKVSTNQLKGELSLELEAIRDILMSIYTEIEAIVNFPEDEIDASSRKQLFKKVGSALARVEVLLKSGEQGRILKEGIKIVLCGKPNVGKSSLLNVLLKQPRAIVSEIAGTTRDTIEETAQIKGIPFQIVDTAGILEPRDLIEKEAVKRSQMYIKSADLILLVLDASQELGREDQILIREVQGEPVLAVLNKCDLPSKLNAEKLQKEFNLKNWVEVSALRKTAIEKLEDTIVEQVLSGKVMDTHGILVSNARHLQSLRDAQKFLQAAQGAIAKNFALELPSEEIKLAVNSLDAITGKNIDADLLDKIFSEFCIGK